MPGASHFRWDDLPREQVTDRFARRLVSGQRLMLAHVYLDRGCIVPWHQHDNEQVSYVLQGALRFWTGEDETADPVVVRAGEVLVIPSSLPHRVEALEDSLSLDLFSPPRQDWLDGSDHYLRDG